MNYYYYYYYSQARVGLEALVEYVEADTAEAGAIVGGRNNSRYS